MAPPPVNEASVAKWRAEKLQELALMTETPLNKGKKLDHQEILARMSSEIGQDERDVENERKLFNKLVMKIRPGLTQAVTNESFPSNDCNCFFV